ncbi:MAG: XRE family transcriptional regulator [Bacteroidales bacterium]|nr:XRE family transcriptional regulator [Bacteroidales bacterium]
MKSQSPHIGNKIMEILLLNERKASWLAKKMNCSRICIYDIINREHLNTELIVRIGNALNFDFFQMVFG